MHRSSDTIAPGRKPGQPRRLSADGSRQSRQPFLHSKTNSETCVTVRIRWRAPLVVGRLPRHRYDLCRKYRECRKIKFAAPGNAHCRSCRCSCDSVRPPPAPEGAEASMACGNFRRGATNAIPFTIQPVREDTIPHTDRAPGWPDRDRHCIGRFHGSDRQRRRGGPTDRP
jgi:hypothetical protein